MMRTLPRLSFEQWRAGNRDLEDRLRREVQDDHDLVDNCFYCDGEGTCECDTCGHFHHCVECDGTGGVPKSERPSRIDQEVERLMLREYDEVVAREDALVRTWGALT